MTDEHALLAAIAANPDDDTVRLAYADFLEEGGDADRAEFIRVQVELAREAAPRRALERRQRNLLTAHKTRWIAPLAAAIGVRPSQCHEWEFRRGFVECIRLSGREALSHGGKLAAITPIRELTMTPATSTHVVGLTRRPWIAGLTALYLPDTNLNPSAVQALLDCRPLRKLRTLRARSWAAQFEVIEAFDRRFRRALT